jgi:hypothetical protein
MNTKTCTKCGIEKEITEYSTNFNKKWGQSYLRSNCKACDNARSRQYHADNKAKRAKQHKEWRNKKVFGLDSGEYELMLTSQDGVCAICKNECSVKPSLAVDHDHITGKVRGLLCSNCNNGLGRFKDNVELLSNAIGYLNKSK